MDDRWEQKRAYQEHWENTQRLIELEKEWRIARQEGQAERVSQLDQEIQKWRILLEKSKARAYQAALRVNLSHENQNNER